MSTSSESRPAGEVKASSAQNEQDATRVGLYDPHRQDHEMDLVDLVRYLWERKWQLIICGLIGTIIGIYIALTSPPVYEAKITLVPAENDSGGVSVLARNFGGLAALGGINLGGGDTSQTPEALALLKSRAFLEQVIAREGWLTEIFADQWDSNTHAWNDELDAPPNLTDGYEQLDANLSVSQSRDSSLVTVALQWDDPDVAASWLNTIIAQLNQTMRARAIREAERNLEYLERELTQTSIVEVQQSIYGLIESQINTIMIANVREGYVFRIVDPAAPPPLDRPIKPRKPLLVILGGMLGGIFGLALLGLIALIRAVRHDESSKA